MSTLPEDLEGLLVGQPPVDWPAAVGRAIDGSTHRRRALLAGAALLVLALLGGVLVLAGGDDSSPSQQADRLTATPTPSPTATAAPTRAPLPEVTPTPLALAADTTCERTPPPARTLPKVAPGAPGAANTVRLSVVVSCTTIKVGEPLFVRATSTATQDRATAFSSTLTDNGLDQPLDASSCSGTPLANAGPGADSALIQGTFAAPGRQRVTVLVRSPDACVAAPGAAAVVFDVTVLPKATPTPTPTPTPSPIPTRSATPSPTPAPTTTSPRPRPTTVPPSPRPTPTVNPVLGIDAVSTRVDAARPGQRVTFTLTVHSNVGRPAAFGRAGGVPGRPSCPPRERYSYGAFSGRLNVTVTMPNRPGPVTVYFLIAADPGCPASGRAVVAVSSYLLAVE